jgi:hypothetical protein
MPSGTYIATNTIAKTHILLKIELAKKGAFLINNSY